MAQRKVFGRVELANDDIEWKVELRKDGVWVRRKHYRTAWHLGIRELLRLCTQQPELFTIKEIKIIHDDKLEASNQSQPVPGVQEGQLVRDNDGSRAVHAGGEQPAQDPQVGGAGLDTQGRDAGGAAAETAQSSAGTGLPENPERVA